jgi:microsomal dipeptidase-like Zn-dependent dipeptidase
MLWRVVRIAAILLLALFLFAQYIRRTGMFFPDRYPIGNWDAHAYGVAPRDETFVTRDGVKLHGWLFRANDRASPLIVWFHGNGGNITDRATVAAELARRGVAYVTIAHLFYRSVATNAPALPFLPDRLYRLIFHQPNTGLTDLGEDMVRALVHEGVLVDVTHMSAASLRDTFALLDELDPERHVPVLATHMACRFGRLEYNLDDETIARIAERRGACGAILCDHYARDGLRRDTEETFAGSVDAVCRQIDRVREVTRSDDHAAIGSDLDGYIKPMLSGLEDMTRMKPLAAALHERYGARTAEAICSGNALRVLRSGWTRRH